MSDPIEILEFWLTEVDPKFWYQSHSDLDDEITERFAETWQVSIAGGLDHWLEGAAGSLAFIILTDQFPRNMFREDDRAFASDALALKAAIKATERQWHLDVPAPDRQFFYMPFEHSEDLAMQDRSVALIRDHMPEGSDLLRHAEVHRHIIRDFGRFPYRNILLDRQNTPAEEVFLEKGGYLYAAELYG
ncbi:MAG: hypothetical protein ACI9O0_001175 [Paracoccaceae bacterium]|jgi:uncharacterized protein (DUF924 family)